MGDMNFLHGFLGTRNFDQLPDGKILDSFGEGLEPER